MARRISVCLTTYNRAKRLAKTLESLQRQSARDYELIISDDCSTDETRRVVEQFARRDERIHYFRNSRNLGMPGNLNAALSEARGEYIANLHDGDIYREDLLAKWSAALDEHPSAAFVFCQTRNVGYGKRSDGIWGGDWPELIPGRLLLDYMIRHYASVVWGTVMARRMCYQTVGPFDMRFGFISDVDMWMRLAARYDVAYVAEPLIALTPRERTHRYFPWNWDLLETYYDIHRENIYRRDGWETSAARRTLFHTRLRRDRHWLLHIGWCVYRRRWDMLRDGLRRCSRQDSRLLRAIGHMGGWGVALIVGRET